MLVTSDLRATNLAALFCLLCVNTVAVAVAAAAAGCLSTNVLVNCDLLVRTPTTLKSWQAAAVRDAVDVFHGKMKLSHENEQQIAR